VLKGLEFVKQRPGTPVPINPLHIIQEVLDNLP
jgi:DNA gyrase/topoisomerase IV subunit B